MCTVRSVLLTQADPASGVVSPLHLMIMAFCVPTLFCFLAGFDLLHLTGSERAYLVRRKREPLCLDCVRMPLACAQELNCERPRVVLSVRAGSASR